MSDSDLPNLPDPHVPRSDDLEGEFTPDRPVMIFADQIKQGMVVERPVPGYRGVLVTVTQVRITERRVIVLGETDEADNFHYEGLRDDPWVLHKVPTPDFSELLVRR